ncbi:MAG: phosphoribosyl-ATP diphosphatase [Oxalobacteraceae bacterium]|nr:MAG: phosphoribosyl-ATP diphosphatase [Oxalobacteraceae bacterium]
MSDTLRRLAEVIESRKPANGGDPDKSYVSRLFAKGDDAILKKIGEEATETVMAAKDARVDGDSSKVLYECADLWFHTLGIRVILPGEMGVWLGACAIDLSASVGGLQ